MPEVKRVEKKWVFLEIYQDQLVERSKTPKKGFKETKIFEKDKVTEKGVTYLRPVHGLEEFLLRDIVYKEIEMPDGSKLKNIDVVLQDSLDSKTIYKIQFKYPSIVCNSFMKKLPNVKFGEPLNLAIYPQKDRGSANVKILHGDQFVQFYHTNDNPNGMPKAKNYGDEWDYKEQNYFLLEQTKQIAKDLAVFWRENWKMFETTQENDEGGDYEDQEEGTPNSETTPTTNSPRTGPPVILSTQEQLATFKPLSKEEEDSLPF